MLLINIGNEPNNRVSLVTLNGKMESGNTKKM